MDLSALLTEQNVKALAKAAGIQSEDVSKIAAAVLPELMAGMASNAKQQGGADALLGAMMSHANDADDKIDLADGMKVLGHVLGANQQTTHSKVAQNTGMDAQQVAQIAAMMAPMVLSSLGKQKQAQQSHAQAQQPQGMDMLNVATSLLGMLAK